MTSLMKLMLMLNLTHVKINNLNKKGSSEEDPFFVVYCYSLFINFA